MFFTQPLFLFGTAFVLIPIIIHIIFKRRKKIIQFPSISLIAEIIKERAKKLFLQDILLLLLRILIIALLVLAFSRPAFRSASVRKKSGRTSAVIILDNSMSMGYYDRGETLIRRAKKNTIQILDSVLKDGDDAALIRTTDDRYIDLTRDLNEIRTVVEKTRLSFMPSRIDHCIKLASSILADSVNNNREIYIVSDMKRSAWMDSRDFSTNEVYSLNYPLIVSDISPDKKMNVFIKKIRYSDYLAERGKPHKISVYVENGGNVNGNFLISIFIADKKIGQLSVFLKPGEVKPVIFPFMQKGQSYTEGYIILENDDLNEDNKYFFSFYMPEYVRVLCAGNSDSRKYVVNALNTDYFITGNENSVIKPEIKNSLNDVHGLNKYDIIFFHGINGLTDKKRVRNYVMNNGSIVLLMDRDLDINAWNQLYSEDIVPRRVVSKINHNKGIGMGRIDYNFNVFLPFKGYRAFSGVKFYNLFKLEDEMSDINIRIPAVYQSDDPFILFYEYKNDEDITRGNGIIITTDFEVKMCDFQYHAAFAPFIYQIVRHTIEKKQGIDKKLYTGMSTEDLRKFFGRENELKTIKSLKGEYTLNPNFLSIPGLYKYGKNRLPVNVNTKESELEKVKYSELKKKYSNKLVFLLQEKNIEKEQKFIKRYHIWRALIFIAFILVLLELLISNNYGILNYIKRFLIRLNFIKEDKLI